MKNTAFAHGRTARTLTALGLIAAASLVLSGCSATEETASAGPQSSSGTNSELADKVAKLMEPSDSLPVPTEALDGVDSLAGETIFYIPITTQAPQFQVTGAALTQALDSVDVKTQICNGNATPSEIASCVDQAINSGAKGIVTDGVPYMMAANAFDTAQAAGLGVVVSNQITFDGYPASDTLTYINAPGVEMYEALGAWIAQDSEGDGAILENRSADGPATIQFATEGEKLLAADCPDCTVTVNEVSSSNYPLIPSSTSSALVSNPNIEYLMVQFAQYLQPSMQAITDSGATGRVQVTTGAAQLGALQAVESGQIAAAVGQAAGYQGWAQADAVMRLALGAEPVEYTIPVRLFTSENIGDVDLTDDAEVSSAWFGPDDFMKKFAEIWGK